MPFGPEPLGFAYFAAAKFAGYSGYAALLNRSKAVARPACRAPAAWKSGFVRTGIGVVVGVVVGLGFWKIVPHSEILKSYAAAIFFVSLVPVRVLEWYFFLWLMYRRCDLGWKSKAIFILGGIVISFLLDALGFYAILILPGGAWIC
jgi:hypothetical protein